MCIIGVAIRPDADPPVASAAVVAHLASISPTRGSGFTAVSFTGLL